MYSYGSTPTWSIAYSVSLVILSETIPIVKVSCIIFFLGEGKGGIANFTNCHYSSIYAVASFGLQGISY